jgi:hypothetical protein
MMTLLNAIIIESTNTGFSPIVGERLFNDLLNNTANYDDLLNVGTYVITTFYTLITGLKRWFICTIPRYQMFGGYRYSNIEIET